MALVEAADGRLVLITVGDGELLAGGDQVFEDREAAVAALEEGRSRVDRVFAAPGLLEDAAELDLSELQAAPEFKVRGGSVPLSAQNRGRRRPGGVPGTGAGRGVVPAGGDQGGVAGPPAHPAATGIAD